MVLDQHLVLKESLISSIEREQVGSVPPYQTHCIHYMFLSFTAQSSLPQYRVEN